MYDLGQKCSPVYACKAMSLQISRNVFFQVQTQIVLEELFKHVVENAYPSPASPSLPFAKVHFFYGTPCTSIMWEFENFLT